MDRDGEFIPASKVLQELGIIPKQPYIHDVVEALYKGEFEIALNLAMEYKEEYYNEQRT
jgi:hypothetical protein